MAPPSPCLSPKPKIHSRSTTAFPLVPHQQSLSSLLSECFSFFHLILFLQVSHFPASILIHSAIICCLLCFVIHSHRNHHAHLKNRSPGLPWWLSGEESTCQCRRHRFDPWSGKIPHAAEQLSPCATTTGLCSGAWEMQLLSPRVANSEARVPYSSCCTRGATAVRSCALQRKVAPAH